MGNGIKDIYKLSLIVNWLAEYLLKERPECHQPIFTFFIQKAEAIKTSP
jgi:hypothetical protein